MQKQREPGQYWVRPRMGPSGWLVATWDLGDRWIHPAYPVQTFTDQNMIEIDETPVTREPKTECEASYYAGFNKDTAHLKYDFVTRESIVQLSYQVERIANALEKHSELTHLQKELEPLQESYDLAMKLSGGQGQKESINLTELWEQCKQIGISLKSNRERFLDVIMHKLSQAGSVFGEINQKQETEVPDAPDIKEIKVIRYGALKDGGTIEYRDIHNQSYFVPAPLYQDTHIYRSWPEHGDPIPRNIRLVMVSSFLPQGGGPSNSHVIG